MNPGHRLGRTVINGSIDWEGFKNWVLQDHTEKTAREIVNYAKKYYIYLVNSNFKPVAEMRKTKRTHVLKALSNLAKFLGIYEDYKQLIRTYDISWSTKNSDDLIIERLTKVKNPNEMFEWIKKVKKNLPELSDFMDFMVATGLRFVEAVNSYNLIIDLAEKGKLNEYYNEEKETLEHFKFKDIFLRKSKKAFISFVPKNLIDRIARNRKLTSTDAIQRKLGKHGIKRRFGDIRELYASYMVKHLSQPEIDFLQGRVSATVFMRNYFNPAWISDLKERAIKGAKELIRKVCNSPHTHS